MLRNQKRESPRARTRPVGFSPICSCATRNGKPDSERELGAVGPRNHLTENQRAGRRALSYFLLHVTSGTMGVSLCRWRYRQRI